MIDQQGDYVLGLKGNQSKLHDAVEDFFVTAQANDFRNIDYDYEEELDKGQGRLEMRRYRVSDVLRSLPDTYKWKGLKSIGYSAGSQPASRGALHACRCTSGNEPAGVRIPNRFAIRQPGDHVLAGSFCRNACGTGVHSANRWPFFSPLELNDAGIPITQYTHQFR